MIKSNAVRYSLISDTWALVMSTDCSGWFWISKISTNRLVTVEEIPCEDRHQKTVVHILDDPVERFGQLSSPEGPSISDVFVNAVDPQQAAVLLIGDKYGVDHFSPVVELLVNGKPKAEGIRPRQHDLHPLGRVDIGK